MLYNVRIVVGRDDERLIFLESAAKISFPGVISDLKCVYGL